MFPPPRENLSPELRPVVAIEGRLLLWWQWYKARAHINAWEGEVLFTSDPIED